MGLPVCAAGRRHCGHSRPVRAKHVLSARRATPISPLTSTSPVLEGTWDGDGDGLYGEVADACDLGCDLRVGRAPVVAPQDAVAFVAKSLTPAPGASSRRALLMAEGGPFGGEIFAEVLVPLFDAAIPPWSTTRLYGNPTGYPGTSKFVGWRPSSP